MNDAALDLSGELADELAANDQIADDSWRTAPERFSTLKLMSKSPLHYLHARQRGYSETLSMRLGSGSHAMLFGEPYVVFSGRRAGKDWVAFKKDNPGALILTDRERYEAQAMADAVRGNATAHRLLFSGAVLEKRIDWEWQGRAFRSTPDAAGDSHIVDLKCLRSADPDKVVWQSRDMHYNAQAAMYRRALAAHDGRTIKDCYLVVVENKAPHPVTVLRFTETALETGDRSCAEWMERLRDCEQRNEWPGYRSAGDVVDLDVPATMDDFTFGDDNTDED